MAGELFKPNVKGFMNPELNKMTDLVIALLDDYIVKYGSNELAYKNLVKEVVKGLPEGKRWISAVVKPAVAEALKYTNIEKFSKNDFGRMTRALATVLATEPDMYGDTFEKIL